MDPFQELYWISVAQTACAFLVIVFSVFAAVFIILLTGFMVGALESDKQIRFMWLSGIFTGVFTVAIVFTPSVELLKMRHVICVQKIEQLKATTAIVRQE